MMIGIDIVDISRMNVITNRHGDRFLDRIFTQEEIAFARKRKNMGESLAGRFAAKEAFMKALGRRLVWKDINVLQTEGKPYIDYHGRRYEGVSISHERSYAVAVVLIGSGHVA